MIFCIAGKNDIAICGLKMLLEIGIEKSDIKVCVNRTDNNEHNWQPSLRRMCSELDINTVEITTLYDTEDLFFLSLEYDRIIDVRKFKSKRLYNIHFSFLPEFKGMYTSAWPILLGKSFSGVTLHKIDSGIDTGDIIDQIKFEISNEDTAYDLYLKYLKFAKILLSNNIRGLIDRRYVSYPQSQLNASYFSKISIDYSKPTIDLKKTAFEIKNQIRAFSFRPYQLPEVEGFEISHAIIMENKSTLKAGTVYSSDDFSLRMSTIDFDVVLYKDILNDLLNAAKKDNLLFFKCIENLGYNLSVKNNLGWDVLIVATYNESRGVFDYLLEMDFDIHSTNFNGTNCFMYALTAAGKSGNMYFMQRLLEKGANVLEIDNYGKNALEYASIYNNAKVLEFLNNNYKCMQL